MSFFSAGDWVIQHWDSLAAFALLIGGFTFAWKRQLGRSLLCFLGCVGVFVIGGL